MILVAIPTRGHQYPITETSFQIHPLAFYYQAISDPINRVPNSQNIETYSIGMGPSAHDICAEYNAELLSSARA